MEDFLKGYLLKEYHPTLVARFLNAFDSRLDYISKITGFCQSILLELAAYNEVRNGGYLWKNGTYYSYTNVPSSNSKAFWSKLQSLSYDIITNEPEGEKDMMGRYVTKKKPSLNKIINKLGSVCFHNCLYNSLYKEVKSSEYFISVETLIKQLSKMRGTILYLDLSSSTINEAEDIKLLMGELQYHDILLKLNLSNCHINEVCMQYLCLLKNTRIKTLILRKNYGPSEELLTKLKECIDEVLV